MEKIILKSWSDPAFAQVVGELYGGSVEESTLKARMEELSNRHKSLVGTEPKNFYSTSGRTELAGNHTDHNKGKVLAGSIQLDIMASVSPREANVITFWEPQFGEITIFLDNLKPVEAEKETTQSLIRGIANGFKARGLKLGGFNACLDSQVLVGSGLSSSAGIEVLIASILNEEFNNGILSPLELAIIGQEAENNYFGKPSGLMDQVACAVGGIVALDFSQNPPKLEDLSFDFTSQGYRLAIVNTHGNHADLTPSYSAIPAEMKEIAGLFGKETLSDVNPKNFYENWGELKDKVSHRSLLRAHHFFAENERVDLMREKLSSQNIKGYLNLVLASGSSSAQWLQNLYTEKDPSEQSLNLALARTESLLTRDGAWRVHGGGFAGTIQVYVPIAQWDIFRETLENIFGKGSVVPLSIRSRSTGRFAQF